MEEMLSAETAVVFTLWKLTFINEAILLFRCSNNDIYSFNWLKKLYVFQLGAHLTVSQFVSCQFLYFFSFKFKKTTTSFPVRANGVK